MKNEKKIKITSHTFYKINNTWWEVIEKEESYFTGSRKIHATVPSIIKAVDLEYIEKLDQRIKKLKRILIYK